MICCLYLVSFPTSAFALTSTTVKNVIEVETEYALNEMEAEYLGDYYLTINVPEDGRIKIWVKNISKDIYEPDFTMPTGDGTNSFRLWNKDKGEMNSGWITVDKGYYQPQICIDGFRNIDEETVYIEFQSNAEYVGEDEDNNSSSVANDLEIDQIYQGNYSIYVESNSGQYDNDYFKIVVDKKGWIDINLENLDNDDYNVPFELYSSSNKLITSVQQSEGDSIQTTSISVTAGTYYLNIMPNAYKSAEYSLEVGFRCYSHEYEGYEVLSCASFSNTGTKEKICSVCGDIYTETIYAIKSAALSEAKYVYDGEIKKPDVIIKDTEGNKLETGVDYTVNYDTGRKKVGRYKVKIKFIGDYTGAKTLYFTIVPKATATLKTELFGDHDNVKISWKKVTDASGYLVSYKKSTSTKWSTPIDTTNLTYKVKNLDDGKKYDFKVIPYYKTSSGTTKYYSTEATKKSSIYTLKAITQKSVKKYSSSKVTISWSDISGETGYQVYKMTKKNGKYTVVKSYKTSKNFINISSSKGTKYYYKIRAYKKESTETVYGPWSKVKSYKL